MRNRSVTDVVRHLGSILLKIDNNDEKIAILNEIFSPVDDFPRSYKSALREWKAHNVLYKLYFKRNSTMHTDIEAKPLLICRICYFILSLVSFIE